jgi:Ca2+/Na+ antiporter
LINAKRVISTGPDIFFIEIPVPSQERERAMYLCVRGIYYALFYDFSLGFWNCSHNMFFLLLIYVFLY